MVQVSAALKYTLGRIGLFVAVLAGLWLVDMNVFLKLMLALVFSAALSFFLLRGWRDEMAGEIAEAAERRRTEKERLRSALAGDDQPPPKPQTPRVDHEVIAPTRRVVGQQLHDQPRGVYQLVELGTLGQGLDVGLMRYAMPPEPPETPPLALVRLVRSQICSNCARL